MFTLKLFKRRERGTLVQRIESVQHVTTEAFNEGRTMLLRAFKNDYDFVEYYIGERTEEFTAIMDENHWGWGLLENWEGNTSQHFRPYTHG